MFADDTKMWSKISNLQDCVYLQEDIDKLQEWSKKWLLAFNTTKCKIMRLGNNQIDYQYKLGENNLEETISEKDLGIYIDNKLRLSDHVDAAVNKANRLVGLIRRSYEYLDKDSLVQLYKALVRPHLEYGHVIWPLYFKTDLNKVDNVQRRMTKLMPQIRDLEYPERLWILKLPSIAYRRSRGDMIKVYKLLTGKYSTNEGLLKINRNSSTRGHHLKLEKQRFRLQIRRHFFPIRVVNPWNSLPKHVVLAPALNTFKNRLDRYNR